MAVRAVVLSNVSTAPEVVADGTSASAQAPSSFLIKCPTASAQTVYVGGDDLTSANAATHGYPLAPGDPAVSMDLSGGDKLYAVTTAGTGTLAILKTRS